MNGIEMLLRNAGLDLEKAQKDFSDLKDGVVKTLQEISTRLNALEHKQAEIIGLLSECADTNDVSRLEDGQKTIIEFVKGPSLADAVEIADKLQELIEWKRAQEREAQVLAVRQNKPPQPAKTQPQPQPEVKPMPPQPHAPQNTRLT